MSGVTTFVLMLNYKRGIIVEKPPKRLLKSRTPQLKQNMRTPPPHAHQQQRAHFSAFFSAPYPPLPSRL